MNIQIARCLRNAVRKLSKQPHRLKLVLAAELASLYSCAPVSLEALTQCPRNQQQDCHMNEYAGRVRAGEFMDSQEKLEFLSHFRAVLAEAETEWKVLQYLVAGARSHRYRHSIQVAV